MKLHLVRISFVIIAVLALTSCKDNDPNQSVEINTPEEIKKAEIKTPDVADQAFKDGMTGKVWHNYLQIKYALTRNDAGTVKDLAGDMAKSFTEERPAMKSIAQKMAEANDIEKQRELFSEFTEKAGPMFEDALSGGTIYKKFCPMAFNNKGAYWYADVEEITNPYFGDKMLKCGSVEKTIKK